MISAQLLNSDASLNNFFTIEAVKYVPGETVKINIKLINDELGIRYIPGGSATVTLSFPKTDNTTLNKTATLIDTGDRSMWTVTISAAESLELASNTIEVTLDKLGDGTDLAKAMMYNTLSKNTISGDC